MEGRKKEEHEWHLIDSFPFSFLPTQKEKAFEPSQQYKVGKCILEKLHLRLEEEEEEREEEKWWGGEGAKGGCE